MICSQKHQKKDLEQSTISPTSRQQRNKCGDEEGKRGKGDQRMRAASELVHLKFIAKLGATDTYHVAGKGDLALKLKFDAGD